MKCPVCKEPDLIMSERQGIEIDYCPTCRGVWLDQGELDKIIEKSIDPVAAQPTPADIPRPPADPHYYEDHSYHDDHYKHGDRYGRKQRSWFGDLFD
jgi:Zn-finger nucleic acid-binding protein